MNTIDKLIETLNPKQKEAVKSQNKNTLILAGAGSGKTKVLTSRVAYLISLGVEPTSILSVTFTNKAAGEMKSRIVGMLNELEENFEFHERDLSVGTFHSICSRLLRRHYQAAGLNKDFTIIDSEEQKSFLKEIIEERACIGAEIKDAKEKRKAINAALQTSLKMIGDYKDKGIRPENLTFTRDDLMFFGFDLKKVYEIYEEEKTRLHLLDFGDLILGVVELFKANPSIRRHYQDEYRHILVDEFQDTNEIQSELINLLHDDKEGYLFVVGDDDQSIYEWRGAKIENILNFDKKYPNVKTVRLEQNYRSTNNILKCANGLISRNKNRKGKDLWSDKEDGSLVRVGLFNTPYEEAQKVAEEIKKGIAQGVSPSDFAILYRSNYISRIIEGKLSENQIAYTIIGGLGFWSRMEVKDLMSYLTLCVNSDNNMAFDRVVNTPSRKIGKKKLEQIKERALFLGVSRFEALKNILQNKEMGGQAGKAAQDFVNLIEKVKKGQLNELSNEEYGYSEYSLEDKLTLLLDGSGLIEYYQEKDEEKAEEREQNLNELLNAAKFFKNENPLEERDEVAFISYAVLQSTADKEAKAESVQLMTVHAAKGLEFRNVFLMAWEDGIFPSENAIREGKIEEERRLAYVAITRAEKNLMISSAGERFPGSPVTPSRFIAELPRELIKESRAQRPSGHSNFYKRAAPQESNWNKFRAVNGYKIGSKYQHPRFGEGIILSATDAGDTIELKVKFEGLIGLKVFMVEKK